jgi:hypothetical protein
LSAARTAASAQSDATGRTTGAVQLLLALGTTFARVALLPHLA